MITIDGFFIDAAITEEHTFETEISSYPVETGSDVTDHVRLLPKVVTIEGLVSDTPIGKAGVARAGVQALIEEGLTEPTTPSGDAVEKLLAVLESRQPILIETSLRAYKNMVIESLSIPRDAKTGDALAFTATFREIILVTNERTRTRVAMPQGSGKRKVGRRASTEIVTIPVATLTRCVTYRLRQQYLDLAGSPGQTVLHASYPAVIRTDSTNYSLVRERPDLYECIEDEPITVEKRGLAGVRFVGPDGTLSEEQLDRMSEQYDQADARLNSNRQWIGPDNRPIVQNPASGFPVSEGRGGFPKYSSSGFPSGGRGGFPGF